MKKARSHLQRHTVVKVVVRQLKKWADWQMNWKESLQRMEKQNINLRSKSIVQTQIKWTMDHMRFKFPAQDKVTRTGNKWKQGIRYKVKLVHSHRRA